ncbi:hypothetical protein Hden_2922 [Hyphomicrobium denitrificans ATCC 51888]|uniref:Uncharacterized protein n=1 Tax=Hyphomicrobium denitrificans (strain ATCC 51888 / DSM 1869 / NCIMB 11706 / TK 0415) TaxID=582899 RepID=D8JUT8_HYPDA|nr:hypothetical protein [Hyphomicrobium denitrificans]ADJ24718.1 hypothetical protein Hden_2922 [Hyphomicrobium denitrificans ATCC 51888]
MIFSPRSAIALLVCIAVASSQLSLPTIAAEISRAEYEACQARDDAGLRTAVVAIATDAITNGTKTIDYGALVDAQWRERNLDQIIDNRVDIAVTEITNETSWTDRLKTLADNEKAQQLATAVAERVYRSDAVKTAIADLASGVAKEVGKSIEFASTDATNTLLQCLKAFVGPRYGGAVASVLAGDASRSVNVDPNKASGKVSAGSVLNESTGGLAGATILIVRRQLANLAQRVGQRIVGSVLSRVVSVVAGGVGLVLIAKDLWDFRNGVLPIIATEMKSPATKVKVREELANTLATQMNDHIKEIAEATADQVIEVWQTFRRAHALVLQIADQNGDFRAFLDRVDPQSLPRLDEVVSILAASEGQDSILRRLQDGSLNQAVHLMPDKGLQIARETNSVATGLAWTALAGKRLDRVVDYELHRRMSTKDLTTGSLDRILDLNDRAAITKIAGVPAAARDALFSLDVADLNLLLRSLSEDEIESLAGYLDGLRPGPREAVLKTIAASPAKMQLLASRSIREGIIASQDQEMAARMMLADSSGLSPKAVVDDARLVFDGRVAPSLLWSKHPQAIVAAGLLSLIVLAWFARLFRRRRPAQASESKT